MPFLVPAYFIHTDCRLDFSSSYRIKQHIHTSRTASDPSSLLQALEFTPAGVFGLALHEVIVVVLAAGADEEGRRHQRGRTGAQLFDLWNRIGKRGRIIEVLPGEPRMMGSRRRMVSGCFIEMRLVRDRVFPRRWLRGQLTHWVCREAILGGPGAQKERFVVSLCCRAGAMRDGVGSSRAGQLEVMLKQADCRRRNWLGGFHGSRSAANGRRKVGLLGDRDPFTRLLPELGLFLIRLHSELRAMPTRW